MKTNLYMTILCFFLYLSSNLLGNELLYNNNFEIGTPEDDSPPTFVCKWWRRVLSSEENYNSWLSDGTYNWMLGTTNQALVYKWGSTSIYQDFEAKPEENYEFSIDYLNPSDTNNRWQARIQVEWYDASYMKIGGIVTVAEANNLVGPFKEWVALSNNVYSPVNTAYGRILLDVNNKGVGSYWNKMYIDNASVTGISNTNNIPPSFISSPYDLILDPIYESSLYSDSLTNYADDKNFDTLSFTSTNLPDWLSIDSAGMMTGTPYFEDAGDNSFTVTVDDGRGASETRMITIPVIGLLSLANIFDDDMVLQRGKPVPVWGKALPNTEVNVTMSTSESEITTSDTNGNWSVTLPSMTATTNGPVTMTITSGTRTLQLTNILVGDVWFCSGQSNMGFELDGADGSAAEIAGANYQYLRHVETPSTFDTNKWNELDRRSEWMQCTPETAGGFSAVAYFFGKKLQLDLGIPIGLINSSKGGSRIEKWAPSLSLPGEENLYNSRVFPYTRMAIAGIIWYQGEANVADGPDYSDKLLALANDWRDVWNLGTFPLYFVQIAPYDYSGTPDVLPRFWAAQTDAMQLITNCGMAVINDVGNINNIHPKVKEPVGNRLALWAEYGNYGFSNLVHSGPFFNSVIREGNSLRVNFDHVGSGLASRDGNPLNWFEISGKNFSYTNATAVIEGDSVIVSAPSVAEPEWVRFAWSEIAEPNLMNIETLPANSFEEKIQIPFFVGDLLQNGNFETGNVGGWMSENFYVPPWDRDKIDYGNIQNVWLTDESYYPYIGPNNQGLIIRWQNTFAYQDFPVVAGENYSFSVKTLSDVITNQWRATMKVEWYDFNNSIIGNGATLDELDVVNAPKETWIPLTGISTAPGNAVTGRIVLTVSKYAGGNIGFAFFDNASIIGALVGITYKNWTNENDVACEPLDDFDHDLVVCLDEYAFNLNPTNSNRQILVPETGVKGIPFFSLSDEGTNSRFSVEFLRRRFADDLVYSVEVSSNMTDWNDITKDDYKSYIDNSWERVITDDPVPFYSAGKARFIRVKVAK